MRTPFALAAAAIALSAVAAGPAAAPPDGIDHELVVAAGETADLTAGADDGAVNVWTHFSVWDPETCSSTSPDNRCQKVLVHFTDAGEATLAMSAAYAVADYDLVVYESSEKGSAFNVAGHSQSEVRPIPGEGPVPVPGDEEVVLEVDEGSWYLAVVYYRAAGGGFSLSASLA